MYASPYLLLRTNNSKQSCFFDVKEIEMFFISQNGWNKIRRVSSRAAYKQNVFKLERLNVADSTCVDNKYVVGQYQPTCSSMLKCLAC